MGKFTVPRKKSQDGLDSGLAVPIIRAMKLSEYNAKIQRAQKSLFYVSLHLSAGNMNALSGLWQDIECLAAELQQVKEIEDD